MGVIQQSGFVPVALVRDPGVTSSISSGTINQIIQYQNETGAESYGYTGWFNTSISILSALIGIFLGGLIVALPLANMGVSLAMAAFIQTSVYTVLLFEMIPLWRGIPI